MGDTKKNKEELLKQISKKKKGKGKKNSGTMFKDKRMNIMVNKVGLTEEQANWCTSIHKKYSIWIANQIKENPDLQRREGDFRMILDWKKDEQQLNLNDYTFETALATAREAHGMVFKENNNSLKNKNIVLDCGDYKWVQLVTSADCVEEGNAMGHCIGGHGHAQSIEQKRSYAFSLRDEYNRPHLTLEASAKDGRIFEFKGRSNGVPALNYVECYVALAQKYADILGTVTDSSFTRALQQSIELAQRINMANSRAIPQQMKIQLGLNMFNEGENFMQSLFAGYGNNKALKTFVVPKELSVYGNLSVESNKIEIKNGIKVGGSVVLSGVSVIIGENFLIGGNLDMSTCTLKKIPKGLKVCGDIIFSIGMKKYEKELREKVVLGGEMYFGKK